MSEWEMACCGEPFRVGSQVTWFVAPIASDSLDWLGDVLPSEERVRFRYHETHHGPTDDEPLQTLTGTVATIRGVFNRPRELVLDSLTALDTGTGYEKPNREFRSYLIELDSAEVRPTS